jgi:hypothetical protein
VAGERIRPHKDELLDAVRRLDPTEFRDFVAEVLELRAARQAPQVLLQEGDLLLGINAGLPEEVEHRSQV